LRQVQLACIFTDLLSIFNAAFQPCLWLESLLLGMHRPCFPMGHVA
jgi:hypothetical protein